MQGTGRRFLFGRCLGRGSFGEVYAAQMRSPGGLETQVAVKLLRSDIDLHGSAVQRLRDEGRLLARLNHPAILTVYDLITLDDRLALITELVDGADLSSMLADIPPRALLQALGQVAGALAAANAAPGPEGPLQLVHRDVKPSNIRVDRHGRAKLLDFGIARFDASDREVRTASDLVVGSVPYMAPERFVDRHVHPSSDIFSLGCCLYEGLVGKRLYGTSSVAEISSYALQEGAYANLLAERLGGLDLHPVVFGLLVDLIAVDPQHRPTAAEAADRCEEAADQLDGPSLRMWCQDRAWPEDVDLEGPLEGSTLTEFAEPDAEADDASPPEAPELPVLNRNPVETVEAGQVTLPPSFVDQLPPESDTYDELGSLQLGRPAVDTYSDLLPPRISDNPPDPGIGRLAVFGLLGLVIVSLASVVTGLTVSLATWFALTL